MLNVLTFVEITPASHYESFLLVAAIADAVAVGVAFAVTDAAVEVAVAPAAVDVAAAVDLLALLALLGFRKNLKHAHNTCEQNHHWLSGQPWICSVHLQLALS